MTKLVCWRSSIKSCGYRCSACSPFLSAPLPQHSFSKTNPFLLCEEINHLADLNIRKIPNYRSRKIRVCFQKNDCHKKDPFPEILLWSSNRVASPKAQLFSPFSFWTYDEGTLCCVYKKSRTKNLVQLYPFTASEKIRLIKIQCYKINKNDKLRNYFPTNFTD